MRLGFFCEALPYLPSRDGFRIHGANLICRLAKRHRIDLVALAAADDPPAPDWAAQYCSSVTIIPAKKHGILKRLANLVGSYGFGRPIHFRREASDELRGGLRSENWDALHIEGEFAGGLTPSDLPVAKVLAVHDSWVLRCEEMLKCDLSPRDKAYYRFLRWNEPRFQRIVYPRFEACTVVSDKDAEAIRRAAPAARVSVISNGTDVEYFRPERSAQVRHTLVFHGNLGYGPNIASSRETAESILPLVRELVPDASLHLVGASPSRDVAALTSLPGVRISSNLPDLRSAVSSGEVYICAVRRGSGIKNKLLEAMALELPVVAVPESIAGVDCTPGRDLLVGETPAEIARLAADLMNNHEKAVAIAKAGRKLVEDCYSWESRARRYEELYEAAIRRSKRSCAAPSPGCSRRDAM